MEVKAYRVLLLLAEAIFGGLCLSPIFFSAKNNSHASISDSHDLMYVESINVYIEERLKVWTFYTLEGRLMALEVQCTSRSGLEETLRYNISFLLSCFKVTSRLLIK